LVELLVVVGIVGVLASLLLPALARSKENSRRVNCLSNLRQMGIAAQLYTEDHDGSYPIAYQESVRDGVKYSVAWDFATTLTREARVEAGLLWRGVGVSKIQQCPSYRGKSNWGSDPHSGYNYNASYIGHGQFETIPEPARVGDVRQPAGTVIFGDGEYGSGANKFMRAPWASAGDRSFRGRWAGTQGFRHQKKTNAAFCDGHVETMRGRFVENQDGAERVADGTGFLSPDNSVYDLE
jgi:prepilin-type processing-associated H-X9-DG protein